MNIYLNVSEQYYSDKSVYPWYVSTKKIFSYKSLCATYVFIMIVHQKLCFSHFLCQVPNDQNPVKILLYTKEETRCVTMWRLILGLFKVFIFFF